jgi:hypothetical protein
MIQWEKEGMYEEHVVTVDKRAQHEVTWCESE